MSAVSRNDPDLVRVTELAASHGVSYRVFHHAIQRGQMQAVKCGWYWFATAAEAAAYLSKHGRKPPLQRLMRKVAQRSNGCWEWQAYTNAKGYGVTFIDGRIQLAHRAMYELHRGAIPPDQPLDHLCRNPRCVNPEHLEIVTPRTNALRGLGPAAINAQKECCPKGHPLSGDNLLLDYMKPSPGRRCRQCRKEWLREYHRRNTANKRRVG